MSLSRDKILICLQLDPMRGFCDKNTRSVKRNKLFILECLIALEGKTSNHI